MFSNDTDGDEISDDCDSCYLDALNDLDGDGLCADVDPDDDNDGCLDDNDLNKNVWSDDSDGDGFSNDCDQWVDCPDTGIDPYDDCGVCNGPGTTAFYYDIDEDGLGDEDEWLYSCTQPLGYVSNADDSCPYDPINDIDQDGVCGDEDNCPDVSNSGQLDTDDDLDGDACDADDDNDGCLDDVDNNPIVFSPDSDEDGNANDCDTDDDNDLVFDNDDQEPLNPNVCSDIDTDGCDDCSSGTYNELNDGFDYDADGMCDLGDSDDDNDGALDEEDSDDNNAFVCSDIDADGCDDCSSGLNRSSEDGFDFDEDGLCDVGDIDDDNDGALDDVDSDDNNPNVCSDNDGDTCDDCTSGSYDVANDGFDFDSDLFVT